MVDSCQVIHVVLLPLFFVVTQKTINQKYFELCVHVVVLCCE